ncbi:hypothetical protein ACFPIF_19545 [Brevundimonas faecalis]|uniref:hypothetical protein n=1 Tax=Brevundimonas faecalis TaxID=947378 RepID=UPI0036172C49
MLPADVLDLRGAAARLGVGYDWFQSNWRTIDGFPPPFLGAGKGQRPRWALRAVLDFINGRRWTAHEAAPVAPSAARPVANDTAPTPLADSVAALLAAAGG